MTAIRLMPRAGLACLALALFFTNAYAAATDYRFELVEPEIAEGPEAIVAVRLIDERTKVPVSGAIIFATRLDMAPEGMEAMTTAVEAMPSTEPGVYRFRTDLRPDDRRNGILDDPHPGGHSGRLRLGEGLAAVLVECTEESQSIQCRTTNVQRRATMRRREFLFSAAAAASAWTIGPAFAAGREMVVYKDPNCGCCHAWAEAMKGAGFAVGIKDVDDLSAVKQRYAIPDEMQGCHTAVVGGYYVEGHVPLDAVERLLAERPDIAGIAVPGMPVGSLGMGDDPRASYDVFAVKRDGTSAIYQSVRPKG